MLEQRDNNSKHLRIDTGSKKLNDLLGGGIERGVVTEIAGPVGTGKTQLCHTLSFTAKQQEQKRKLHKTSVDDGCEAVIPSTRVLFIDTKKAFDRHRIYSIAQARGKDSDADVASITVETIRDFQALEEFISNRLEEFLKENPETVLVIVDSINALQPLQRKEEGNGKVKEEDERGKEGDHSLSQQSLDSPVYLLLKVASQYDIAVVLINETETTPDCSFEQTQSPTVGNIISHASTYGISFKNHESYKVARIIHSPCHPEGEATFTIEGEGVTDVHQ